MRFLAPGHAFRNRKGYQNNKPHMMKVAYRPNHYVLSKKGDTAFRSLDGRPLEAVNLDTMGGARKFREQYDRLGWKGRAIRRCKLRVGDTRKRGIPGGC